MKANISTFQHELNTDQRYETSIVSNIYRGGEHSELLRNENYEQSTSFVHPQKQYRSYGAPQKEKKKDLPDNETACIRARPLR